MRANGDADGCVLMASHCCVITGGVVLLVEWCRQKTFLFSMDFLIDGMAGDRLRLQQSSCRASNSSFRSSQLMVDIRVLPGRSAESNHLQCVSTVPDAGGQSEAVPPVPRLSAIGEASCAETAGSPDFQPQRRCFDEAAQLTARHYTQIHSAGRVAEQPSPLAVAKRR